MLAEDGEKVPEGKWQDLVALPLSLWDSHTWLQFMAPDAHCAKWEWLRTTDA